MAANTPDKRKKQPPCGQTGGRPRASIRRQMSITLMTSMGLLWLLLASYGLYGVRHEAREISDAQLSLTGHVLMTMLAHEIHEGYPDPSQAIGQMVSYIFPTSDDPHTEPPAFIVRSSDDRLMLHSRGAKPLLPALAHRLPAGLSDITINEQQWRVLVLQDETTNLWVAVAHPSHLQQQLARELALNFIIPLLFALFLLGVIIHFAVRHGLDSLRRLTNNVSRRSIDDASSLTTAEVPAEALPLTIALDQLLERLHQAREREHRFIADATHELRTPLAGLKTQAQVALRAADKQQRNRALESLNGGVDRAARLISQLLTLARLDHSSVNPDTSSNDLLQVTRDVCAELSPAAISKHTELELSGSRPCLVIGDRTLLVVLVRNLVENAIHYGGEKPISIAAQQVANAVELTVRDHGPGIRSADLSRVFERFYRGSNQHAPGSGLGLAIVHRIVTSLNGGIQLRNHSGGGLLITVQLAAAKPTPGNQQLED